MKADEAFVAEFNALDRHRQTAIGRGKTPAP